MPSTQSLDPAAGSATGRPDAEARWLELLRQALAQGSFASVALGRYRGTEPGLERVRIRALGLRGQASLHFVYRYATRDVTKNLPLDAGLDAVRALLAEGFEHAHLLTDTQDIQLARNRRGVARLQVGRVAPRAAAPDDETPATAAPAKGMASAAHDRAKPRWVDIESPWLVALGVTDAQHRLVPSMARKWKQINKFVEIFDHAFRALHWPAERPLRVLDFGSGKGYLSFALHAHLRGTLGLDARVTGVELREELVRLCNDAAAHMPWPGLAFEQGDVRALEPGEADVMIALHACDTATDHALHAGVRTGAKLILGAPCCHKELRPQMRSPALLTPLLRHGIHLGQQAEMVTDGLRALLLEAEGYDTQVFEFVALEHTSKNKMILATRRERPLPPEPLRRQVEEIKAFYGVRAQCLDGLLARDRAGACAGVAPNGPADESGPTAR